MDGGDSGLGSKCLKADGESIGVLGLKVKERGEEVVPDGHETEQGNDGESGLCEGENDFGEDAPFGAAIDFGGFGEFHGDGAIELTEEEDIECSGEPGRNPERTE